MSPEPKKSKCSPDLNTVILEVTGTRAGRRIPSTRLSRAVTEFLSEFKEAIESPPVISSKMDCVTLFGFSNVLTHGFLSVHLYVTVQFSICLHPEHLIIIVQKLRICKLFQGGQDANYDQSG